MGAIGKQWTDEEEQKLIQDLVDRTSKEFKGFIRSTRPKVTEGQMEGQSFIAKYAEAGPGALVDTYTNPVSGKPFRNVVYFVDALK